MSTLHRTYLGLGSNLGNRQELLSEAIREIEKLIGHVVRQSAFIESEPWGFSSCHPFLNAAIAVDTTLSPQQLLRATQTIEQTLGKQPCHATERNAGEPPVYHDRPIDIDILLYDQLTIHEPNLIIPHPKMKERPFVMRPLEEIIGL